MTDEDFEPFAWDAYGWEMTFVDNMKALRELRGMSQTELARRVAHEGFSFHQPTVQRIESGQRPLKLTEAVAIAQVLGSDLHKMMADLGMPLARDLLVEATRAEEVERAVGVYTSAHGPSRLYDSAADALTGYEAAAARLGFDLDDGLVQHANDFLAIATEVVRTYAAARNRFKELEEQAGDLERKNADLLVDSRDIPAVDDSGEHPETS